MAWFKTYYKELENKESMTIGMFFGYLCSVMSIIMEITQVMRVAQNVLLSMPATACRLTTYITKYHRKPQVNHLTHLSHSESLHGKNDSKM